MALRHVLDLLLPPRCPACATPCSRVWCARCRAEVAQLALPDGWPVDLDDGIRGIGAYAYAGPIRDTVVAVKVRGQHEVLPALGVLMRTRLRLVDMGPDVAWTWVPTTPSALRSRGVDVPRHLAGPAATPLLRTRARRAADRDQTELDPAARRLAKADAFAATGPVPPRVVLIDDVRTTGATALAAATALRAAGARRVLVATFAVAGQEAIAAARSPR
jgi:predicted amidophosphoribosyltransferase